jgi:SpoVK/Ycf46/Vps4 family AAA+-type ATPase
MSITFDSTWFSDAMAEVDCKASSVVILETADPYRHRQLLENLAPVYGNRIFRFTPWHGWQKVNSAHDLSFAQVATPAGAGYAPDAGSPVRDLELALRRMDPELRASKTAFLISGMEPPRADEAPPAAFTHALRAWSCDKDILRANSVVFVAAPAASAIVDPATLGQCYIARPPLATDAERLGFVRSLLVGNYGSDAKDRELHTLAAITRGLNLHQLHAVLLRACHKADGFISFDLIKRLKADYMRRSEVIEIEEPDLGFDDIGGYDSVKRLIREVLILPMRDPQRAVRTAVEPPRGILLYGPPGTGKTLLAKALAKEANLPFINFKTENLFSQYLGETGQRLSCAIRLAEQSAPAIVFIDEIDRFGTRTTGCADGASQETRRVFSQMLEWLGNDNRKSIVVGTTNVPEQLDSSFTRPGRFSALVPVLYPDRAARLQILRTQLGLAGRRLKPAMCEEDVVRVLPQMAAATAFSTGADLELLVARAKQLFFNSKDDVLHSGHLLQALAEHSVPEENGRFQLNHYRALGNRFAQTLRDIAAAEPD